MARTAWTLFPLALLIACGGKRVKHAGPIVGWHQKDGWPGACYYPPNYDSMGIGDRKIAREHVLDAMVSQWSGKRNDGVKFPADKVDDLQTVLLGQPTLIEKVSVQNLQLCQSAMAAGGQTLGWGKWLRDEPAKLTAGQCKYRPMDYQLFDYLDITHGWQIPVHVCAGNKVEIKASTMDQYQISPTSPWTNANGDRDKPTLGTKLPCNFKGCYAGEVIMRFTGDSGATEIHPVGTDFVFTAPEHGTIEVQINDDTWFDNKYRIVGTIEHHTSISYQGE